MKEIRLENFRCYTELSIPLKSRVNLLVGDNATGKTSVLRACKFVLSAFFSGFSDDNTKWVNPGNEDFMQMETGGILLQERPIHISFDVADVMGKEADSTGGDSFYTLIKKSELDFFIVLMLVGGFAERKQLYVFAKLIKNGSLKK